VFSTGSPQSDGALKNVVSKKIRYYCQLYVDKSDPVIFLSWTGHPTTGSSVVSPSSLGVDSDMSGEITSGVTDSNFPHKPPRKTVVFNYYTLVSDDLISSGPNSGHYKSTFKYNIKDESGKDNPTFKDIMNKYYEMWNVVPWEESYKQNRLFQPYRGLGHRFVN
jgi:hypothetical protein